MAIVELDRVHESFTSESSNFDPATNPSTEKFYEGLQELSKMHREPGSFRTYLYRVAGQFFYNEQFSDIANFYSTYSKHGLHQAVSRINGAEGIAVNVLQHEEPNFRRALRPGRLIGLLRANGGDSGLFLGIAYTQQEKAAIPVNVDTKKPGIVQKIQAIPASNSRLRII